MNPSYDAGPLFWLNHAWAEWTLIAIGVGIALGMWRALFRRPAQPLDPQGNTVQRHTATIAVAHWANALGCILAMYSGASLIHLLPRSFALATLYQVHYTGLTLMLLSLLALATHQFIYGGHSWRITGGSFRDALVELIAYAGLVGDKGILGFSSLQWPAGWRRSIAKALGAVPGHPTGKYLPTEKVFSLLPWMVVLGAVVVTGLVKGARYLLPVPAGLLQWATLIHDWCVYAGAFMLVVHVAALVVVRTNWPLLGSMFTTRVSAGYAAARHPQWVSEIAPEAGVRKASAGGGSQRG